MNKKLLDILIERLNNLNEEMIEALQITTKNNEIKIKWEYPIIQPFSGSPVHYDSL